MPLAGAAEAFADLLRKTWPQTATPASSTRAWSVRGDPLQQRHR
jgi:hypothetical protein